MDVLRIFGGVSVRGCDFKRCEAAFVEIAILHCGSRMSLLHVCGTSFLESTTGGLLQNDDNFIYRV